MEKVASKEKSVGESRSKNSSSKRSSSASKSSATNWVRRTRDNVFEICVSVVSAKRLPAEGLFSFLIVVAGLLSMVYDAGKDSFILKDETSSIARYFYVALDPTLIAMDITSYSVLFISVTFLLFLSFMVFVYLLYSKSNSEILTTFVFVFARLSRTLLVVPTMNILLSPLNCSLFSGTLASHAAEKSPGAYCYDFPYLLYAIISVGMVISMLGMGTVDCLFFLEKYRDVSLSSWVVSPNGRFNLLIYYLQVVSIIGGSFLRFQDSIVGLYVFNVVIFILTLLILLGIIRFLPWYHFQAVFTISTGLLLFAIVKLTTFVTLLTGSYFSNITYFAVVFLIPCLWIVLLGRYFSLLWFFRNKVHSNILLCYFSTDIATGVYVRNKLSCILCCGSFFKKNKVSPSKGGISNNNMMEVIRALLDDDNFEKTKDLCSHLITLVSDKQPLLAKSILNHTNTIMSQSWPDVEFSLNVYKLKLQNIQEHGESAYLRQRNRGKMMTELSRIRIREEELSKLMLMILQELNSEDRVVNFSNFPKIITTIQVNQEYCEKTYQSLIRLYPSPLIFRRYSNYLMRFYGDFSSASVFLKEANQLEFNEGSSAGFSNAESELHKKNQQREPQQPYPQFGVDEYVSNDTQSINDEDNIEAISIEPVEIDGEELNELNEEQEQEVSELDDFGLQDELTDENVAEETKHEPTQSQALVRVGSDVSSEDFGTVGGTNMMERVATSAKLDALSEKFTHRSRLSVSAMKDSGERSHVQKKIQGSKFLSFYLVQCLCLSLFLVIGGSIIAIFVMSFVLESYFSHSAELIKISSHTENGLVEVSHFLRKLQVTHEERDNIPFTYERNTTTYNRITRDRCDMLREYTEDLYFEMDENQRKPFSDIKVNIADRLVSAGDMLKDNTYHYGDYALYDSLTTYTEYCDKILTLDESVWTNNNENSTNSKFANEEIFFYLILNEPILVLGMQDLIKSLVTSEESRGQTFTIIFIMFPAVVSLFSFLVCCIFLFFRVQQKRAMKGFLLIPKDEILRLSDHFSLELDESEQKEEEKQNRRRKDETLERNDDLSTSSTHDSRKKENVRVDTVQFSMIQRFCLSSCGIILLAIVVFSVFTTVGIMSCEQFVVRNVEYDHTLKMQAELHRCHKWAVEMLYPNSSLFDVDFIKLKLGEESDDLLRVYEELRFGDEEKGLPGNDGEKQAYDIYYRRRCDAKDESLSKYERLNCLSMNNLVDYMVVSTKKILYSGSNVTDLRKSDEFETILMIDNFSNGSVFDEGAISKGFNDLFEYTEHKVDTYLNLNYNLSLLLMILFLPTFCIVYMYVFRSFPSRLNHNLTMVRRIMILMKKDILMRKEIYDYMVGKSSRGGSYSKLFKNERANRMEEYFDLVEMSNYGFVCFDNKLNIIHYNATANELFRIKASEGRNLRSIFDKQSLKKIRKWIRRNLRVSFSGELIALYENQSFPVLAEVSKSKHHKKKFIGVFENMESTKKKDLLKESERRTEQIEILMKNILPLEIAKTAKLEDFETGKCVVYQHKRATAYFADICNFSGMSQQTNPETIIKMLHKFFSGTDLLCEKHGLEKIKTIGDCYFCVSGIPTYKPLHAVTAMEFSIDVLRWLKVFNERENPVKDWPLQVRTGLSSGELVAGIIGRTKRCYDIWGSMINEAARMESHGLVGKIQVSRGTYESIFDRYEFMERRINLQGIGTDVLAYVYTPTEEILRDNGDVVKLVMSMEESKKSGKLENARSSTSVFVDDEVLEEIKVEEIHETPTHEPIIQEDEEREESEEEEEEEEEKMPTILSLSSMENGGSKKNTIEETHATIVSGPTTIIGEELISYNEEEEEVMDSYKFKKKEDFSNEEEKVENIEKC